jgi:hypothetical protein
LKARFQNMRCIMGIAAIIYIAAVTPSRAADVEPPLIYDWSDLERSGIKSDGVRAASQRLINPLNGLVQCPCGAELPLTER